MDNDSAQNPQSPTQPVAANTMSTNVTGRDLGMRQPHIPISENEMMHEPPQHGSGKNTFLTLVSILILAGVVGITLFLYIQNKTTSSKNTQQDKQVKSNTTNTKALTKPTPYVLQTANEKEMAANLKEYGTVCKRFTSVEEALITPQIACSLDLSAQNLTSLPDISKLTNLNSINLSANNFSQFPPQLLNVPTLVSIDLSNNQLAQTPDVSELIQLQSLILTGNPIANKVIPTAKPPTTSILKIIY